MAGERYVVSGYFVNNGQLIFTVNEKMEGAERRMQLFPRCDEDQQMKMNENLQELSPDFSRKFKCVVVILKFLKHIPDLRSKGKW